MNGDLFTHAAIHDGQTCAPCMHLDVKPLDSGVRYCWAGFSWRRPDDPACDRLLISGPSWRPPFAAAFPNQAGCG